VAEKSCRVYNGGLQGGGKLTKKSGVEGEGSKVLSSQKIEALQKKGEKNWPEYPPNRSSKNIGSEAKGHMTLRKKHFAGGVGVKFEV